MISYLGILLLCTASAQASTVEKIITIPPSSTPTLVTTIFVMPPSTTTVNVGGPASNTNVHNAAHNVTQTNLYTTLAQHMASMASNIQKGLPKAKQTLYNNKFKILGAALAGLYGYTWYKLVTLSNKASEENNWHAYKSTLSLEELLQVPQSTLAQELVGSIQQVYASQAIESFFTPFVLFTKDIDQEIIDLEQLLLFQKHIQDLHVAKLFPWEKISPHNVQQKLQRALYLKNVVLTWLSTFKVESNTKNLSVVD